MSNLVTHGESDVPITTTGLIADGIGQRHKSVIQLFRTHSESLSRFGEVSFSKREIETATGTQLQTVGVLNEQQATLLMTHMRNTEQVLEFKYQLVKAFYEMREAINNQKSSQPTVNDLSRLDIINMAKKAEEERIAVEEKNKQLEQVVKKNEHKAAVVDQIVEQGGMVSVKQAAQLIGTGQNRLFEFLRRNGWVTRYNQPYQRKIEQGYLDSKVSWYRHNGGDLRERITTQVTTLGVARLERMLKADKGNGSDRPSV